MPEIIVTTFDWVPELPRGFVRDLRIRWALEEAGLAYRVESTPFHNRSSEHFSRQPFGQVPWLTDGEFSVFETGAMLLHVGELSEVLIPSERHQRSAVIQWLFAGLNSVEMAALPWALARFTDDEIQTPVKDMLDNFLAARLNHIESNLAGREWLCKCFSVADIVMADVLRLVDRFDGLANYPNCRDYMARATARPAFQTALADQMAHFAAAD